jgi:hypothetical protein
MALTDQQIDELVLRVLAGQSPGYLIQPDASAFVAAFAELEERFDRDAVEAGLGRLADAGHARELEEVALAYQVEPKLDHNDEPILDPDTGEPILVRSHHPVTGAEIIVPATDENGNEIIIAQGFELTEAGVAAAPSPPESAILLEQDWPSDPTPVNPEPDVVVIPDFELDDETQQRISDAAAAAVEVAAQGLAPASTPAQRQAIVGRAREAAAAKLRGD